jgi:hypothetical protein
MQDRALKKGKSIASTSPALKGRQQKTRADVIGARHVESDVVVLR